jgi:purine-binding chemotaxis protein CheW
MKSADDKKEHVDERQLVVFCIGDEEFGIEIKRVNNIIKMEKITKIPNSEFFIEGVINLRGKIIVIVNLHKKLGLAEKALGKDTRIIVVELENEIVGMVVDSVKEVLRIEEKKIEEAPQIILEKIDSDYLQGVGVLKDRLIILLDVDKVLHKKDIESIKKIGERIDSEGGIPESKGKKEASPESYFWFNNGKAVKNIEELMHDLEKIDDDTFQHHVNRDKNDFSEWVEHVLNESDLAKMLRETISKQEMIGILKRHI